MNEKSSKNYPKIAKKKNRRDDKMNRRLILTLLHIGYKPLLASLLHISYKPLLASFEA